MAEETGRSPAAPSPGAAPGTPPPVTPSWLPAAPRTAKHAAPRNVPQVGNVPTTATPPAPAARVTSGPGTAVIPAVATTAVATPTLDVAPAGLPARTPTLHRVSRRKPGRAVGFVSALLGTGGLLLGLIIAAVNVSKWPALAVCQAYSTAHKGGSEFGCGSSSRSLAEIVPPVGCALLVLAALAGIWIPSHSNRRRGLLLLVFAALLIAVAGIEAAVYAALPS